MEKNKEDKIITLLPQLIQVTNYSVLMTAELKSRKVFSIADESHLNSIPDLLERVKRFYEIILTKVNGYDHLIACLRITRQSAALKVLGEIWNFEPISMSGSYFGSLEGFDVIKMDESVKRLVEQEVVQIKKKRLSHQDNFLLFNVRAPSKLFTGRSKELTSLRKIMTNYGSTAVISQSSYITGMGGIGKTELTKKFIHSIDFTVDCPIFNTVVWINAENEITASKDFITLATDKLRISTLNANGGEEEIQTVLDKIYDQLKLRKTLIVFDNVENSELIEKYVPTELQASGSISVIITSQEGYSGFDYQIRLTGMEEADAIEFVRKGLSMSGEVSSQLDIEILQLVNRFQCFPLAIEQAVAYINDRKKIRKNYGPQDYLTDLSSKVGHHLLSKHFTGAQALYKKTIYEIVTLTLEKIRSDECFGSAALNIVQLMAFMQADDIPDTMFKQLYEDFILDGALSLLERHSIIAFSHGKNENTVYINIHRLVQDVIRIILDANGEEKGVLTQTLELCEHNSCLNTITVDHFVSCWNFGAKNTALVKAHANVPAVIANVLIELSRFEYAYNFATSQIKLLQNNLSYDEKASELANLELTVGVVLGCQFKIEKAKEHISKTVQNILKYLSESNPVVLKLQAELGKVMTRDCKYDEALKIYTDVYNHWKLKLNGRDCSESLYVLHCIGEVYHILKQYDIATETFLRVIHESENNEFKDYSTITAAKFYLALEESCLPKSLALINEACSYGEEYLHKNHRVLILAKLNLGVILERSELHSEAFDLYHCIYKQLLNIYGADHRLVFHVKLNIVYCMIELGHHDELFAKAAEVYDEFKQKYGQDFYLTLSAYKTVGVALYFQNKPDKALLIFEKCFGSTLFLSKCTVLQLRETKLYASLCLEKLEQFGKALVYLNELVPENCSIGASSECGLEFKILETYDRIKKHFVQNIC